MTCAEFTVLDGEVIAVTVSGHSGYAPEGEDIVCAAVSGAVSLCDCILKDVFRSGARVEKDDKAATVTISLSDEAGAAERGVLKALKLYLTDLSEEYPSFLKVTEKRG